MMGIVARLKIVEIKTPCEAKDDATSYSSAKSTVLVAHGIPAISTGIASSSGSVMKGEMHR